MLQTANLGRERQRQAPSRAGGGGGGGGAAPWPPWLACRCPSLHAAPCPLAPWDLRSRAGISAAPIGAAEAIVKRSVNWSHCSTRTQAFPRRRLKGRRGSPRAPAPSVTSLDVPGVLLKVPWSVLLARAPACMWIPFWRARGLSLKFAASGVGVLETTCVCSVEEEVMSNPVWSLLPLFVANFRIASGFDGSHSSHSYVHCTPHLMVLSVLSVAFKSILPS